MNTKLVGAVRVYDLDAPGSCLTLLTTTVISFALAAPCVSVNVVVEPSPVNVSFVAIALVISLGFLPI